MRAKGSWWLAWCFGTTLVTLNAVAQTPPAPPAGSADSVVATQAVPPGTLPIAQKRTGRRTPAPFFSGKLTLGTTYDNNILDYSARDVRLLDSGTQPTRFAIRSAGDFIFGAGTQFDFRPVIWENRPTRLRLSSAGDLYARDGVKNKGEFGAELRQSLFRHAALLTGIDYLPSFYLRNLFWRGHPLGSPAYARARFRRWTYSGAFAYDFSSRVDVQVGYAFETRNYNREFNERDSKSHVVNGEIDYDLAKRLRVDLSYEFDWTLADGRHNPDPRVVDISNRAHQFAMDFFFRPVVWRHHPFQLVQRAAYQFQDYTSNRPLDRYHFGRKDHEWHLRTAVSLDLTRSLEAGLAYTFAMATTNTSVTAPPPAVSLADVGDYKSHALAARVTVSF